MYCQKINGDEDFSIDEYNKQAKALDLTNLSEAEKLEILHPTKECETQCFDCLAIVGERRLRTKKIIESFNQ